MKYNDLHEVSAAFASGELEGYVLMIDNDESFLAWVGDDDQAKRDAARDLFLGNGINDMADACAAAGIPLSGFSKWYLMVPSA